MTIVFQAVVGLSLLLGLVAVFLSAKNWHWSQLVLLLFILFTGAGVFYMTAKTLGKRKEVMSKIPRLEKDLERFRLQNERLLNGDTNETGIRELDHRLNLLLRERGRVWREVTPAGPLNPAGQIAVKIPSPVPHGLEQGAILYAFETGAPTPNNPQAGPDPQYLGEFRVIDVAETGATLESTHLLTQRTGQRIAESQMPWSLYESMPTDQHSLFTGFSEEELRQLLPDETVDEYIRHGQEASPDDIRRGHVIGLDNNDERVLPDNINEAVKKLYNRPLRDYSYIFGELTVQRVNNLALIQSTREDNTRLETALKSAEELAEFRESEIAALTKNLAGMKQDRSTVESLLQTVQTQLNNAQARIKSLVAQNLAQAQRYTALHRERIRQINSLAPPLTGTSFTSP